MAAGATFATQVVRELIDSGAKVDRAQKDGWTALMLACLQRHIGAARLLKAAGADPRFRPDVKSGTPVPSAYDLAFRAGSSELRRVFEPSAADLDVLEGRWARLDLLKAAKEGKTWRLQRELQRALRRTDGRKDGAGETPPTGNLRGTEWWTDQTTEAANKVTALMLASRERHLPAVEVLLKHKASVNLVSRRGASALMMAAEVGAADVMRRLLAARAAINVLDEQKVTVLMHACSSGSSSVVEQLIAAAQAAFGTDRAMLQAFVDAKCAHGRTALMRAARDGQAKAASAVLTAGASMDAVDGDGRTALIAACSYGHDDAARVLLKADADVNKATADQRTALMRACEYRYPSTARLLVEYGANGKRLENIRGETAEDLACRAQDSRLRRVFQPSAADEDVKGVEKYYKEVPLLRYAAEGSTWEVQRMISKKANPDQTVHTGISALITGGNQWTRWCVTATP